MSEEKGAAISIGGLFLEVQQMLEIRRAIINRVVSRVSKSFSAGGDGGVEARYPR